MLNRNSKTASRLRVREAAVTVVLFLSSVLTGSQGIASFPGGPGMIAFVSDRNGAYDIFAYDLSTEGEVNLTNSSGQDVLPRWSADGRKIAFVSTRSGSAEIYTMNADGSNVTQITNNFFFDTAPTWSPDGQWIAYSSFRDGNFNIYVSNPDGTSEGQLTFGGGNSPAWSPDGTKIAYVGNSNGSPEIFVMNSDGTNTSVLTSVGGAGAPDWSPDGLRLVFDFAGDVYAVQSDGTALTNLTNSASTELMPRWSPDGAKVSYASNANGSWDIYVLPLNGSPAVFLAANTGYTEFHQDWQAIASSADGSAELNLGGPPPSKSGSKRFMVTVRNLGPSQMSNVHVEVSITVNGAGAPGTISRIRPVDPPTLNHGEFSHFQFEWTYPKGSFERGSEVTFSASLSAAQYDPNMSNNTAIETTFAN